MNQQDHQNLYGKPSREDMQLILAILNRAKQMPAFDEQEIARVDFVLSLQAAHHRTPLDLEGLLQADEYEFTHDAFGILRHMDLDTGELADDFLPRFAKNDQGVAVGAPEVHTVTVRIVPQVAPESICEQDRGLPLEHEVAVAAGTPPSARADTALDIFHSDLPVKHPEHFDFQVWEAGVQLEADPNHEAYANADEGFSP